MVHQMERFEGEEQLEGFMAAPNAAAREALSGLEGEIVVLGAGGKMGPTLCRLLREASGAAVTAVSRFSEPGLRERLESAGVGTLEADLLAPEAWEKLPRAPNVYFLAGMKFGASGNEPLTWAMNVYLPALVCRHYAGSRIVAFSTGNVYPFVPVAEGGAVEQTPVAPLGDYAQSCLGRERMFQYFSSRDGTPVVLVRLNYANEPRYGVIVDVASRIRDGQPVDLTMGHVNLIWQGDANDYIARSITLASSPAEVLNVAGPETISVRRLAEQIGRLLGKEPRFTGTESPSALLSDAGQCFAAFGYPQVSLRQMVEWITAWVAEGRPLLAKPTKYQVRDGRF